MFGQFFNIDESAFSIAPNPKYLYLSKQHEEALAHLIYGVTRKGGFVCLTGDIGTGKTTICRCLFEQLPENTDIAFVINPKFSPLELLASICDELHIGYSPFQPSIREYVKKLNEYLIDAHSKGRNTVLVIDEAQNLSVEALEHIRALTNLETNEQKLLQIILIGQPELKKLLTKPELEQVNQRITARFHIGPLCLKETHRYINHRLLVAGAKKKIFSAANIKQIHKLSDGVPRRINILCDRILLGAYTIRKSKITAEIIKQSASEVFGTVSFDESMIPKALAASVIALIVSGAAVFSYQNIAPDADKIFRLSNITHDNEKPLSSANNVKEISEPDKNQEIDGDKLSNEIILKKSDVSIAEAEKFQVVNVHEKKANFEKSKEVSDVQQDIEMSANESIGNESANNMQLQFTGYGKAYQRLFRLWGVDYSSTTISPCEHALINQLHCYQGKGSIQKIIGLNRPVLLKSKVKQFTPSYIVVVSLEGDYAIVNQLGDYKVVNISEIEANWNGEFEMLWRPLQAGISYIKPGQKGKAIALLDQKLAIFQGRKSLVTHPFVYSEELVEQVKAFQVANNLPSDGVVGPITQIHFNNKNTDTPYLTK